MAQNYQIQWALIMTLLWHFIPNGIKWYKQYKTLPLAIDSSLILRNKFLLVFFLSPVHSISTSCPLYLPLKWENSWGTYLSAPAQPSWHFWTSLSRLKASTLKSRVAAHPFLLCWDPCVYLLLGHLSVCWPAVLFTSSTPAHAIFSFFWEAIFKLLAQLSSKKHKPERWELSTYSPLLSFQSPTPVNSICLIALYCHYYHMSHVSIGL